MFLKPLGKHNDNFHYRNSEVISEVTTMGRADYTSTNPTFSGDHHPEVLFRFFVPALSVSHL